MKAKQFQRPWLFFFATGIGGGTDHILNKNVYFYVSV